MALHRKPDPDPGALLRQAIEEQRAVNPAIVADPRPLADDLVKQLLRDAAEIDRIWDEMDRARGNAPACYTGAQEQEGVRTMALDKKANAEFAVLIQQAAAELRATNPELFAEPRPYSNEEYAQILADAAEIDRIWDEMDRARGNAPRRYTGLDAINEDRGE